MAKVDNIFPPGWDEKRVGKVLNHYENQSEEEAMEEDEASFLNAEETIMEIPKKLLSEVRRLLAKNAS